MIFLDSALHLADLGYRVFPCIPGTKIPSIKSWPERATTDPAGIEEWWAALPTSNVAIATDGLVVVDIDGSSNRWPEDPGRGEDLIGAPVASTPGGGRHIYFAAHDGSDLRCSVGKIAPKVDIRANGGCVIAPASRIDAGAYRWATACDIVPRAELPHAPEWLIDAVAAATAERFDFPDDGNAIPESVRNETLFRIGTGIRRFGLTSAEIFAALKVVNVERCVPPISVAEVQAIANSAARYDPDQVTTAIVEDHYSQDMHKEAASSDPGEFPDRLLEVIGTVGMMTSYACEIAPKPQPVLSMAAGIALQAVLCARKIQDDRGNRTNLYIVSVAESGAGKEAPRKAIRQTLYHAGLEDLEGPEDIASEAGLLRAVELHPGVLFQLDEFGRLLRSIGNPKSAPHLQGVVTALMRLFSSADTSYRGRAYADEKRTARIIQPCASIHGTSVPGNLFGAMDADTLDDGFIARLIVFPGCDDPIRKRASVCHPPDELIARVKMWGEFAPGGNLAAEHPVPLVVPTTGKAKAAFADLGDLVDEQSAGSPSWVRSMWARAEEKACRLALVRAASGASRPERTEIDLSDAQWACDLAEHLTRWLACHAARWVSRSTFDARQKRIIRTVASRGGSASMSDITRATQDLSMRDRTELIANIVATGQLVESVESTEGRPRRMFRLP